MLLRLKPRMSTSNIYTIYTSMACCNDACCNFATVPPNELPDPVRLAASFANGNGLVATFLKTFQQHSTALTLLHHPTTLFLSLCPAPLSADARPVSLLLLAEAQGPERGRVPRVGAPRRVGGHPGERAQLRRGRRRRTGPG